MKNSIVSLAICFGIGLISGNSSLAGSPNSFSAEKSSRQDGMRLIDFAGTESLMTQGQVHELNKKLHENGLCSMWADVTDFPESVSKVSFNPELFAKVPTQQELVNRLMPQISVQNLEANVQKLSQYFDRYYTSQTGSESADWIASEFRRMAGSRTDIKVTLFKHRFEQSSVVVEWTGSGALASEVVVLGAHEDSISNNGKAPGADDDASGVSTVLEIFRVLTENQFKPERTLVFMTYAGEELGLLGSQDIAAAFKKNQKNVFGVIQFDMTMYPGAQHRFAFFQDQANPLHQFTKILVDEYVKIPWTTTVCFGCSSDHASWRRNGYAAVFPFEAPFKESNKMIHTPGDTIDRLDFNHGMHFTKLGVAFAVEMSTGAGW